MYTAQKRRQFISLPYQKRIGMIPVAVTVVCSWVFLPITLSLSTIAMQHYPIWGSLLLFASVMLTVYVFTLTYGWVSERSKRYELTFDGSQVQLFSYDERSKEARTQNLSLDGVFSAEYYEPRDSSGLVLKADSGMMAIPLWAFGEESEKSIVSYVRSHGVPILGVPSDIYI